jgi:hypothetical protein
LAEWKVNTLPNNDIDRKKFKGEHTGRKLAPKMKASMVFKNITDKNSYL